MLTNEPYCKVLPVKIQNIDTTYCLFFFFLHYNHFWIQWCNVHIALLSF